MDARSWRKKGYYPMFFNRPDVILIHVENKNLDDTYHHTKINSGHWQHLNELNIDWQKGLFFENPKLKEYCTKIIEKCYCDRISLTCDYCFGLRDPFTNEYSTQE